MTLTKDQFISTITEIAIAKDLSGTAYNDHSEAFEVETEDSYI